MALQPIVQSTANLARPRTAPQGAVGVNQSGTQQLARALGNIGAQLDGLRRARQGAEALTGATTALNDLSLRLEREGDPDTMSDEFLAEAQKIRTENMRLLRNGADQQAFDARFSSLMETRRLSVASRQIDLQADRAIAGLNQTQRELQRTAAAAPSVAERERVMAQFDATVADHENTGFLGPSDAGQLRATFRANVDEEAALLAIEADPAAAAAALGPKSTEFGALDTRTRLRLKAAAESALAGRARAQDAARREAASAARDRLSEIDAVLRQGLPVDENLRQQARVQVARAGDADLAARLAQAEDLEAFARDLRTQPPAGVATIVQDLQRQSAAGATGEDAEKLALARGFANEQRTALANDPLDFAARVGLTEVTPIDLGAGVTAEQLASRRSQAQAVGDFYGQPPVFLTATEKDQLSAFIERAPAEQQLQLAATIARGFGEDARPVLAEIAKQAPLFAHAGGLSLLGPTQARTARAVLTGQEALRSGNPGVVVGNLDATTVVGDDVGTALAFAPQTRGAMIEAARAIYAGEALRRGIDKFDAGLFRDSLARAVGQGVNERGETTGGFGRRNGVDFVLPPDMTPDAFDDLIDGLTVDELAAAGEGVAPTDADGRPLDGDDIADMRLWDVGQGQYLVTADREGRQPLAGNGPNGVYILDVNRIAPRAPRPPSQASRFVPGPSFIPSGAAR